MDFDRGMVVKVAADVAVRRAAGTSSEAELYSDEYHAVQKDRRQCLGLIQFFGELFKLQMLSECIMHESLKKILGNIDVTGEEGIESFCRLLMTVGGLLDSPKAHVRMDSYFARLKELGKSSDVTPRVQFTVQVSSMAYA